MGRRVVVTLVAGAVISAAVAEQSLAQPPVQPGPPVNQGAVPRVAPQMRPAMREHWRALSTDDRQRFKSNAERWLQMPPEERRVWREREGVRRERMQREAEAAMREYGLQLEAEKRAQFEQRYRQERRRIDRALREELQEKRRQELKPVLDGLRKEFTPPQGPASPTAVPSASK